MSMDLPLINYRYKKVYSQLKNIIKKLYHKYVLQFKMPIKGYIYIEGSLFENMSKHMKTNGW